MIYLIAIFISPLAIFLCGKIFQGIINLIIYVAAIILVVTIVFSWLGVAAWAVGVLHAILVVNSHKADKRNQALIDVMKPGKQ